jgi:tetratricopeptide (TPR) repeat protein
MHSRTLLARIAPALALVVAVFALYAQTARHAFVEYDTNLYLTDNPHVQAGLTLEGLRWACSSFVAGNWHPLTWLSHMLDVELFGLRPAGHQLENAGWHALNACLVWLLFLRLGLARSFAFAGALFFAIHPLRAESVAWIAERKDLLCACFGLSSLLAWLSWSREPAAWKLGAALALYACSLLSKAMLVTLPCLFLLLEWWPLGRTSPRPRRSDLATLAFLGLSIGLCIVTVRAQYAARAVQTLGQLPLAFRVENALDACLWYLGKSFWPTSLAFHYPLPRHEPRIAQMLVQGGLLALLTLGAWSARARLPGVLVGWLWFLGTLVPVIGLVQVGGQAHADRYTYVPGIGLLLIACLLAERELLPRIGSRALLVLACAAGAALAWQGWLQIGTWRSTETLALHALAVTKDNSVACNVLGSSYSNAGRTQEGLPLLREAVRIAPGDPEAVWNLASTLLSTRQYAEAEQVLLRASEVMPLNAEVWTQLGRLYEERQRNPEALAALRRATALRADDWAAQLMLGRLLLRVGRAEEARAPLERLLAHEPQNFDALRGLERVELARGALELAWKHAQAAADVRPGSAPILADQAWILALATEGPLAQPRQALELAERALRSGGEQPALLDAFAFAAAANGEFARAIPAAEQALSSLHEVDPDWAGRLEQRLAAYRQGRIDRETQR